MNKDQLQQELKEKIKEGIKPSDLKKKKTGENIGSIPTPPPPPPIIDKEEKPNQNPVNSDDLPSPIAYKIKKLEEEVKFWSDKSANYLKNLQELTAENDNLKEQKKEPINKELEQALKEANEKIRELQAEIQAQNKTIKHLQELVKSLQNNEE